MHEMQSILTDARGICLSVCLSSRLYCAKMVKQINMLFGVNTPGGLWIIVLDGGSDPPTERGGDPVLNFGTLSYLLNFCS